MSKENLTFLRRNGGRLQIGAEASAAMLTFRQDTPEKLEAGGVLLGRRILGGDDIVVDRVTSPMFGDRRSRTRFFRARRLHQAQIDAAWRKSDGTCGYLGEWHSHPEDLPSPSFVDLAGWQKKMLFDRIGANIFFVIVGAMEVRTWEGRWLRPPDLLTKWNA